MFQFIPTILIIAIAYLSDSSEEGYKYDRKVDDYSCVVCEECKEDLYRCDDKTYSCLEMCLECVDTPKSTVEVEVEVKLITEGE